MTESIICLIFLFSGGFLGYLLFTILNIWKPYENDIVHRLEIIEDNNRSTDSRILHLRNEALERDNKELRKYIKTGIKLGHENVEVQGLPSFDGYVYTGEYRSAVAEEFCLSAYKDTVVQIKGGDSPAKVMILRKVK